MPGNFVRDRLPRRRAAFLVAYAFQRKLVIGIATRGGMVLALVFRRGVAENVTVDLESARLASAAITRRLAR